MNTRHARRRLKNRKETLTLPRRLLRCRRMGDGLSNSVGREPAQTATSATKRSPNFSEQRRLQSQPARPTPAETEPASPGNEGEKTSRSPNSLRTGVHLGLESQRKPQRQKCTQWQRKKKKKSERRTYSFQGDAAASHERQRPLRDLEDTPRFPGANTKKGRRDARNGRDDILCKP